MTPSLCVLVVVGKAEAVADVEHDEDREGDADDRPGAPEDADAAEEDHRDDVELETGGEIAADRPSRAANRTPAMPAAVPDAVMMMSLSRATLMPE